MIIGISGALSIIYCSIGLWLLESVGRVKPLIVSAAGLGGALVTNAALSQHFNPNNGNQLRAMVAVNYVFSFFYTPLEIISWVYPAEIFPVEVRALGNAITTFTNWTINLILRSLVPRPWRALGSDISMRFSFSTLLPCFAISSSTLKRRDVRSSRWMSCLAISWYRMPSSIPRVRELLWRRMRVSCTRLRRCTRGMEKRMSWPRLRDGALHAK